MSEKLSTRDAYGHALLELGEHNEELLVLDADLSRSTRTEWFAAKFPGKFINTGIAEQNLIGISAGLSMMGFVPFATTYSIFIGRAYDQIRQAVGFSRSNVKIVATHAGLAASHDGGSHQGIEDMALMRVIPGMTILSPCDYHEAKKAIHAAAKHAGPVYIRLQKEPVPVITKIEDHFQIGKISRLRKGKHVVLIATGSLVAHALDAAGILSSEGIEAEVLNISTIKPLEKDVLIEALRRCGCGVVIEEHSRIGGLYEACAGALQGSFRAPLESVGINDCFGDTGDWQELISKFGLSKAGIVAASHKAMKDRALNA